MQNFYFNVLIHYTLNTQELFFGHVVAVETSCVHLLLYGDTTYLAL